MDHRPALAAFGTQVRRRRQDRDGLIEHDDAVSRCLPPQGWTGVLAMAGDRVVAPAASQPILARLGFAAPAATAPFSHPGTAV